MAAAPRPSTRARGRQAMQWATLTVAFLSLLVVIIAYAAQAMTAVAVALLLLVIAVSSLMTGARRLATQRAAAQPCRAPQADKESQMRKLFLRRSRTTDGGDGSEGPSAETGVPGSGAPAPGARSPEQAPRLPPSTTAQTSARAYPSPSPPAYPAAQAPLPPPDSAMQAASYAASPDPRTSYAPHVPTPVSPYPTPASSTPAPGAQRYDQRPHDPQPYDQRHHDPQHHAQSSLAQPTPAQSAHPQPSFAPAPGPPTYDPQRDGRQPNGPQSYDPRHQDPQRYAQASLAQAYAPGPPVRDPEPAPVPAGPATPAPPSPSAVPPDLPPVFRGTSDAGQAPWHLPEGSVSSGISADAARLGDLEVRAASVIGASHRCQEPAGPRQDAYALRRSQDGQFLIVAVADGVGSSPHSDIGARVAVAAAARLLEGMLKPSGFSSIDVSLLYKEVAGEMIGTGRSRDLAEKDICSILITAVIPAQAEANGYRTVWAAWIGDVSLWLVQGRRLHQFTGHEKSGLDRNALEAVLPFDPGKVQETSFFIAPGDRLALMTDGVSDTLTTVPDAEGYFADQWSGAPPHPAVFLRDLCYDAPGQADDRTAVVVWCGDGTPPAPTNPAVERRRA